jgi:small subunit ribosomal protein S13
MPRLLGVEIPPNKKVEFALRYIYGIGPARAQVLVAAVGIDPTSRAQALTEEQLNKLMSVIADKKWVVEGDLRREIAGNLKRLQAINCFRGQRHRRGLPVRGQRTQTNARTRKGARRTVGVLRKAGPAAGAAPAA